MKYTKTEFEGLYIIDPITFGDDRGFFRETFRLDEFEREIGPVRFVQENDSLSRYGVVRGLHWQAAPYSQAKLVSVARGEVLDVAVDMRPGSPTRGRYFSAVLNEANGRRIFIPKGFAHGFAVLSAEALFCYKVDAPYNPESERSAAWNSDCVNIDWHLPEADIILSPKDMASAPLDLDKLPQ